MCGLRRAAPLAAGDAASTRCKVLGVAGLRLRAVAARQPRPGQLHAGHAAAIARAAARLLLGARRPGGAAGAHAPLRPAEWWPTELLVLGRVPVFLLRARLQPGGVLGREADGLLLPQRPDARHHAAAAGALVLRLDAALHLLRPLHRRGARQASAHPSRRSPSTSASRCSAALTAMGAFAARLRHRRPARRRAARGDVRRADRQPRRACASCCSRQVVNFDYFWATSRVIKDTINEYPFWSFLFADLHAHVLVMPFSLTFLALAVWWVRRARIAGADPRRSRLLRRCSASARRDHGHQRLELADLRAVLPVPARLLQPGARRRSGAAASSLLVLLALAGVTLLGAAPGGARSCRPGSLERLGRRRRRSCCRGYCSAPRRADGLRRCSPAPLMLTGLLVAGAYAYFLPFWRDFTPPPRNFGLGTRSVRQPWDFANIFGLFLFIAIPFLFVLWRRALRAVGQPPRLGAPAGDVARRPHRRRRAGCCRCPLIERLLAASALHGSLRLGLAVLAVLAFSGRRCRRVPHARRSASSSPCCRSPSPSPPAPTWCSSGTA